MALEVAGSNPVGHPKQANKHSTREGTYVEPLQALSFGRAVYRGSESFSFRLAPRAFELEYTRLRRLLMLRLVHGILSLSVACAFFSCSDPVPPAASAGLSLLVGICSENIVPDDVGTPPPSSATGSRGEPVFDGTEGTSVKCSVVGEGSYQISADVTNPGLPSFNLRGSVDAAGRGTATLGLQNRNMAAYAQSGQPCTVTVVNQGGTAQIRPGAAWVQFQCPDMSSPPSTRCMATGELLIERCASK